MKNQTREETKFRRRAMGSITVLTLWAVLFSACLLSVINDLYAFVREDQPITVEITEPSSAWEFSCLLSERGILNHPSLFTLYLKSKDRATQAESFLGTLELNTSMSYREILAELKNASANE